MSVTSNNATAPSPATAPGVEAIDPLAVARQATIDPRIERLTPGFDAPFFQAGLAGYSDAAMRLIARRHGCPYCVTEALLDRTLLSGGRGFSKADLIALHQNVPGGADDHPLAGQIIGCDPNEMAAAAIKLIEFNAAGPSDNTSFQAIDVNLACPVKKIKRKARGGHWLDDPPGAINILKAVHDAVGDAAIVTLKIRRGSDDSPEAERNFYTIFDAAYEIGFAWVTVHGRTVEQKYVGPSRWTFLRDLVRRRPECLVFGSGDVWTAEDIFKMIAYTGVHAVSVARGCIGNPWIFEQARDMMAGRPPMKPTISQQRDTLAQHYKLSVAVNGDAYAALLMRKFAIRFAQHHPQGEEARLRFIKVKSIDDWRDVLDSLYTSEDELSLETESERTAVS